MRGETSGRCEAGALRRKRLLLGSLDEPGAFEDVHPARFMDVFKRRLREEGAVQDQIACDFGVLKSVIRDIKRGTPWTHVA